MKTLILLLSFCVSIAMGETVVIAPATEGHWESVDDNAKWWAVPQTIMTQEVGTISLLHLDVSTVDVGEDGAGHVWTTNGNAAISTVNKKFGAGSVLLDGTTDYLTTADNTNDFNFGTGDWTVDFWCKTNGSQTTFAGLVCASTISPLTGWAIDLNQTPATSNRLSVISKGSGTFQADITTDGVLPHTGEFIHVAVVRNGNVLTVYFNGVADAQTKDCTGYSYDGSGGASIGRLYNDSTSYCFKGNIDEVRITKGYARWTENFTPPTYPYW